MTYPADEPTKSAWSDNVCPGSGKRAIGERMYFGWHTYGECTGCGEMRILTTTGKTYRHNKSKAE